MRETYGKEANLKELSGKEASGKEVNGKETNVEETNMKEAKVKEINGQKTNRGGKRKGMRASILALVLALLCSLMFLCLPAVYVHMQDTAVLSRELSRSAEEGALGKRAREIPLVYALYRRRYLVGSGFSPVIQNDETGAGTVLLQNKISELTEAGILPAVPAQQIQEILNISPMYRGCDTSGDFSAAEQGYWQEPANSSSVMLYWHTDTGLVVSLQASVDVSEMDAKELLRQYRAYLGVEVLNDWMDIDLDGEAKAASWSQTGQLYLYCSAQEQELVFGAVSLSLEEMDETFLQ